MAANAEPLQGNLFGNAEPQSTAQNSAKSIEQALHADLSDQDLVDDALKRPRARHQPEPDISNTVVSESSKHASTAEDDLPAWAHHNLVEKEQLTPMLHHYVELKAKDPERILLYRLGDFFECFFEDAIQLSRLLELTLTSKEGGKAIGRVPMAGVPHHAVERYCSELIRHGLSVALCDQLETTPTNKGALLKRAITRVLTPGTVLEESMLTARRNNWLAAVVVESNQGNQPFCWGIASADVSTGEFLVTQREGSASLYQELAQLEASELLWGESSSNGRPQWCPEKQHLTAIASTPFGYPEAEQALKNHYQLSTLDGLGLQDLPLALRAAGGLIAYLQETKPIENQANSETGSAPIPLDRPRTTFAGDSLVLDAQTRRNLELTNTQRDGQFHGSLLWAVDRTLTAMGGRCLRRWLEAPLIDADAIRTRQAMVSTFVESRPLRLSLRRLLRPMGDLERLAGRAGAGQAGARDLVAIADGLEKLPRLAEQLNGLWQKTPNLITSLVDVDTALLELAASIR
ncbi:MAG TPA: DNA mismatch repair protein MutS, partial [Prochlorococcus sp.]